MEKILHCLLLFPFVLDHTSSVSYCLTFHTARRAEVQEGCNTLQLCDWCPMGTAGSMCSNASGEIVTPSIKACHEHCACYPVSSITSTATMYLVHFQFLHYKLLSKPFLFGAGILWERPVSVLFFLTRGKRKVVFQQFIKFSLGQRTLMCYCAKLQCQLSVRCQKII